MEADLRSKADEWLKAIGCTPKIHADPNASWNLAFEYPVGSAEGMNVVGPKGRPGVLIILAGIEVAATHLSAFEALEDEARGDFLWELRRALNRIEVDFHATGATGPKECPQNIRLSVIRYGDGLTLDSFAHDLGAVYKTKLGVIWTFQEKLDENGQEPWQRFDFRRLGY